MKKFSIFILTLMLIASMAVPAFAVTPGYEIPKVPQVSKIDFKVALDDDFWNRYWESHPIKFPDFDWSKINFKFGD